MYENKIGVVGSGTMGSGIAQVAAQNNFQVLLFDINEELLQASLKNIQGRLARLVEKGKISNEEYQRISDQIETTTDLSTMKSCHIIIEAAPEKLTIKKQIFQQLDKICSKDTILATNTSSLSVTEIGGVTQLSERVAGLHFFNPVPLMPLVEVVKGIKTNNDTIDKLVQFAKKLGKKPVVCNDTPGFIVNRIARPFYNEALKIKSEGLASFEQIDRIMRKAGGFKMGPFELQDLIGIDINYFTTESVHQGFFGDNRFRPNYYQQRMVQSGRIGRKVGAGYYSYDNENHN
jgi:3-hydroxybutyryl-CoA dehydrogenase